MSNDSEPPLKIVITRWLLSVGMALGLAAALLFYVTRPPPVQLVEANPISDGKWQVENGTLALTVHQPDADLTGKFVDWRATIHLDENPDNEKAGDVTVNIEIPSLSLGEATPQALGPDFFDAIQFPTATFSAELIRELEFFEARGTLSLKGVEVPVSFPFDLAITDDQARMHAEFSLHRLDFGIGANMSDETSLGFTVDIEIDLTAARVE